MWQISWLQAVLHGTVPRASGVHLTRFVSGLEICMCQRFLTHSSVSDKKNQEFRSHLLLGTIVCIFGQNPVFSRELRDLAELTSPKWDPRMQGERARGCWKSCKRQRRKAAAEKSLEAVIKNFATPVDCAWLCLDLDQAAEWVYRQISEAKKDARYRLKF